MSNANTTPHPLREDLVANAVEFLQDKSIASSSLTKKIEFIESKGLTQDEVTEALNRSTKATSATTETEKPTATTTTAASPIAGPPQPPVPDYYYNAPPLPERDWKDYFIMATATAGISYGVYQVVKRYIIPKILPPSKNQLENDKNSIEQEFLRVESLLERLETEQKEFYESQSSKSNKIDETIVEINEIIKSTNEKNLHNEETLKYLKLEIDNIKSTLIKSLDSQKLTINNELSELETKLESLKTELDTLSPSATIKPITTGSATSATIPAPPPPSSSKENTGPHKYNLNIPPVSSIPSANDILNGTSRSTIAEEEEIENGDASGSGNRIPAWQLNANNKGKGIPEWQMNAS